MILNTIMLERRIVNWPENKEFKWGTIFEPRKGVPDTLGLC
jgi:hypothetical protein